MINNVLPDWLVALQNPLPGESPGNHISRCVQSFNGVSLTSSVAKLDALFLVNETPQRASQIAAVQTNCATFARCIFALAGCASNYVLEPYPIGAGISLVLQAAQQMNCLISCASNPNWLSLLTPGCLMHYGTPNLNNDHVEFCLGVPDPLTGISLHGGGGRPNNAITVGPGDIRTSLGRPMQHIILPMNMAIAGSIISIPQPAPTNTTPIVQTPSINTQVPQSSVIVNPQIVVPSSPTQPSTTLLNDILSFVMKALQWLFTVRSTRK